MFRRVFDTLCLIGFVMTLLVFAGGILRVRGPMWQVYALCALWLVPPIFSEARRVRQQRQRRKAESCTLCGKPAESVGSACLICGYVAAGTGVRCARLIAWLIAIVLGAVVGVSFLCVAQLYDAETLRYWSLRNGNFCMCGEVWRDPPPPERFDFGVSFAGSPPPVDVLLPVWVLPIVGLVAAVMLSDRFAARRRRLAGTRDPDTRDVLEVIHQAGFTTTVVRLDGIYHITVIDPAGERRRVSGDDPYETACELAVQVGIELEDE